MDFHDRFNLMAHALRPYGITVDPDSDDSDSDDFVLNVIFARAVDAGEIRFFDEDVTALTPRKRKRKGWRKQVKLPYTSSMFYRDYHNKNVQDLSHRDAKDQTKLQDALDGGTEVSEVIRGQTMGCNKLRRQQPS